MRITKIKIQNYRVLRNIDIPLQNLSILIGQNDAGKTSVLNAIEAFFKKKKLKETDWHKKNMAEPIVIELSFEDVPGEHETLIENNITIKSVFKDTETLPSYSYKVTDDEYVPIKSVDTKKYFFEKQFIFIPVNRNIDDQFSASKARGLLRTILDAVIHEELKKNEKVKKDIESVAKFLEKSIKTPEKKIQEFLREQLKDSIEFSFGEFNVDPVDGMSFKTLLSDKGLPGVEIASRGAGTQNNAIIALFRYFAVSGVAESFIFGMEEPENSLHPKAQRQILNAIHNISALTQVIVTTHSPVFIERSHYRNNILMTMSPDGDTVAKPFRKVKDNVFRGELGISVSDALLAGGNTCAILVEGETEKESFPVFMKMIGVDEIGLGISIMSMRGNGLRRCQSLVSLLNSYNVPCVVVFDKDNNDVVGHKKKLEEMRDNKFLPNLKEVFLLSQGALEDYYPVDIVIDAVEEDEGIKFSEEDKESVRNSPKKGIERYEIIRDQCKMEGYTRLKMLIGGPATELMYKKKENVPKEIQDILKYVEVIARTRQE